MFMCVYCLVDYSTAFVIGQLRNNEEPIIRQLLFHTGMCSQQAILSNVKLDIHCWMFAFES